jgi:hypothetical protein
VAELGSERSCGGQASVELVAGLPALLLAALVALQLFASGYTQSLADGAAEAGAMALAAGRPARDAARRALPGWSRDRAAIAVHRGRQHPELAQVVVRLRPPSPIPALADRLEVSSSAWVRGPGD